MFDLTFSYRKPNGERDVEKYSTISNFTDAIEFNVYPKTILSCSNVEARFFENPLLDKHFETVEALYKHCVSIMRGSK